MGKSWLFSPINRYLMSALNPKAKLLQRGRPATDSMPEDVVCVGDCSVSMSCSIEGGGERLDAMQKACSEFVLARKEKYPEDRIAIASFSEIGALLCDLTPVTAADHIISAINDIYSDGGTDFVEGLSIARRVLSRSSQRARMCLFLSDGEHNAGSADLPLQIAKEMKSDGIRICTIGIGDLPTMVDEELLIAMASVVDGRPAYAFIQDRHTLYQHYRRIAETRIMKAE